MNFSTFINTTNMIWAITLTFFFVMVHRYIIKSHNKSLLAILEKTNSVESNKIKFSDKFSIKSFISTVIIFIISYLFITYTPYFLIKKLHQANNPNADGNYEQDSKEKSDPFISLLPADKIDTRFTDIAGLHEAKDEVQDIVKFLKQPAHFSRLGAKSPKGILLHGLPGTGKTLLARAIAGESNVSFISTSGSQFDQEYIGVGADRIRSLFKLARKNAPCIIFIDEIDSVAYKRASNSIAPWSSQTINQLLTEMDGLNDKQNEGVVVMGASNRMDALDPAILRPGRFDRHIKLELPNLEERKEILYIYTQKIKIDENITCEQLAKMTTGFSSAELANFVNEAAIVATKNEQKIVCLNSFETAKDRILLGTKKQSMIMSKKELKNTAYHEAGHALVGILLEPKHTPLYKVTIAPRGPSLGHTSFQEENDTYSYSKEYLENKIASILGGRIAEEIIFGENNITTGAANDLQVATNIAYQMVTKWGYSKKIGLVYQDENLNFIPKEVIEKEVQKIIQAEYIKAKDLLLNNKSKLDKIANALLDKETLDKSQVLKIIS